MNLIDNCRDHWWRLWSLRIHAGLSALLGLIVTMPDTVLGVLNQLPPELRAALGPTFAIVMLAAGTAARLAKQEKLNVPTPPAN